ncbi:S8 family peptidase [Actinoalloteichus hymeniacidonis]|uniref:Subtilase family protease n=1 Tax=Actinoalloteichus hymeniacidonis TaxID=340345 RepID=A0AAC9HSK6_9PSEU|nr:S8 family serine peptidase [Actinoalloteichus hymeniacidonis]AOS64658.1 subtilase family protease [Actinoalloteichus hymeniacidonis]MBB5907267.1 subtilisin family serine protease [Actinoalloteichus hymeniacidonis]
MRRRKVAGIVAVATLTAGLTAVAGSAQVPGSSAHAATADAEGQQILTLITGDRLLVTSSGGRQTVTVLPAEKREGIAFHQTGEGDTLSVTPVDALPLVEQGTLDPRLFQVTQLLDQGFGDSGPLPLIVSHTEGAARTLASTDAEVVRELPSLNAVSLAVDEGEAAGLWSTLTAENSTLATGVERVWLNGRSRVLDEESNAQIGAPEAWEAGFSGDGATIAVLDTGYDAEHPDLDGMVVDAVDFTDSPVGPQDVNGHGTHVASTALGNGAASDGAHRGVAPEASLLVGKVCDDNGSCADDAVIAGMEWAAEQGVSAANLSLGGSPTSGTDPLSESLNTLTEQSGTLFVVAAGNNGDDFMVASPASADAALAVGSVTKNDEQSPFSSRGPRLGDQAVKPDLTAPGSDIIGARAEGVIPNLPADERYMAQSGTSMAAPHVTGAAAILAAQHPEWEAAELKAALTGSAEPLPGLDTTEQGSGRLDVANAIAAQVHTDVSSLGFGVIAYPHDQGPQTKTVTYRNSGSEDAVLDLSFAPVGSDGTAAPAGLFTLNAEQITVPADGETTVDVTVDPSVNELLDYVSGPLIAASADGTTRISTAVAATLEPESYNLTIEATEQSGAPVASASIQLVDHATGTLDYSAYQVAPGVFEARLPVGRYDVLGTYFETTEDGGSAMTYISDMAVDVTTDTTIAMDGTAGERLTVDTDRESVLATSSIFLHFGGEISGTIGLPESIPVYVVAPDDDDAGKGGLRFVYRPALVSTPDAAEEHLYSLLFDEPAGLPASVAYSVTDEELARVSTRYRAQGVSSSAHTATLGIPSADEGASLASSFIPTELPSERTEFFTPGDDIEWQGSVLAADGGMTNRYTDYPTAGDYEAEWNAAPLGMSLALPDLRGNQRVGDQISIHSGTFSPVDETYLAPAVPTGSMTLSRDGEIIGTSENAGYAVFDVPAGPGEYTVAITAARESAVLGTQADATWTFTSDTAGETPEALPMMSLRPRGEVDDLGRAPAGSYSLELELEHLTGGTAAEVTLEISYDDGETWESVPVELAEGRATVEVTHPEGAEFAALRTTVTDTDGNTAEQTMIRAYGIVAD